MRNKRLKGFAYFVSENNIANKVYALGFVVAFCGYSLWKQTEEMLNFSEENKGAMYFICLAFSFCCYTAAYLLTKWDKWRLFPMFAFLICVSRFTKEIYLLYYPNEATEYDMFDYLNFLLTIFLVFGFFTKKQYDRFGELKKSEDE